MLNAGGNMQRSGGAELWGRQISDGASSPGEQRGAGGGGTFLSRMGGGVKVGQGCREETVGTRISYLLRVNPLVPQPSTYSPPTPSVTCSSTPWPLPHFGEFI